MVTVFSLSVSTYVGAPPTLRSVTSSAANTLGIVLSRSASTTRNRDQASHAQNRIVFTPSMTGPSPKSYCSHYAAGATMRRRGPPGVAVPGRIGGDRRAGPHRGGPGLGAPCSPSGRAGGPGSGGGRSTGYRAPDLMPGGFVAERGGCAGGVGGE